MNEDELRQALGASVPDAPEVSEWARVAGRRSLRTRGMVAGGALLTVAVVGALVIGNLRPGGTDGIPAAPASSPPVASPAPASTSAAGECDRATPVPAAPRQLPSGATEVQLCPDGYDPDTTFITPSDRLTQGVPAFLDAINSATARPLAKGCIGGWARTFRMVFRYADGSRITLIGRLASNNQLTDGKAGSCDGLGGPDTWRSGDLLQRLRSAWFEQRAQQPLDQPYGNPDCSTGSPRLWSPSLFAVDLKTVSTAVLCIPDDNGQRPALTTEQARLLAADIARHSRPIGNDDQDMSITLKLYSPWGDVMTHVRGAADRWPLLSGPSSDVWTPSATIRAWLDPLIDSVPMVTPGEAGNACMVNAQPTSGDIPTDTLSLRLCSAGDPDLRQFAPVQALGAEGARSVLAVLRQRPQLGPNEACPANLGPGFLLVAEYSGREAVVMDLQLYGCGLVGTTSDRRTGADEVLAAFRTALTAQRAQDPGSRVRWEWLCEPRHSLNRSSVMPVRLADVTGGTICGYANQTSNLVKVERRLDQADFETISADLVAHSQPWTPMPCPMTPPHEPASALALTTRWADVLTVGPDECQGTYSYLVDGKKLRWSPSSEVSLLLENLTR